MLLSLICIDLYYCHCKCIHDILPIFCTKTADLLTLTSYEASMVSAHCMLTVNGSNSICCNISFPQTYRIFFYSNKHTAPCIKGLDNWERYTWKRCICYSNYELISFQTFIKTNLSFAFLHKRVVPVILLETDKTKAGQISFTRQHRKVR